MHRIKLRVKAPYIFELKDKIGTFRIYRYARFYVIQMFRIWLCIFFYFSMEKNANFRHETAATRHISKTEKKSNGRCCFGNSKLRYYAHPGLFPVYLLLRKNKMKKLKRNSLANDECAYNEYTSRSFFRNINITSKTLYKFSNIFYMNLLQVKSYVIKKTECKIKIIYSKSKPYHNF